MGQGFVCRYLFEGENMDWVKCLNEWNPMESQKKEFGHGKRLFIL